jgi:peptidoglycan pentaglycine glycine transferase (the first glycine)
MSNSLPSATAVHDPPAWNTLISALPHTHLLQSWEWGEFKRRSGWSARHWAWGTSAAAQILTRSALRAALRRRILDDLQKLARRERAVLIKLDPDLSISADVTQDLEARGWRLSPDQIQFRNTALLDLARDESEILAAMKQKTRYNLRLAERKGVCVRAGGEADLDLLYRMYAETSLRDGFAIRSAAYYRDAWGRFIPAGLAQPFIAEVEGEPVSGLVLFKFARTAWYMYGMSRDAHREKMPNHLLQWEAMRWAKAQGCETYDFWGAPDEFVESDPLWGVWKFKEGFGAQAVRHIGAWDYAPFPWLYQLYSSVLPRILAVMRRRGKAQTQRMLE